MLKKTTAAVVLGVMISGLAGAGTMGPVCVPGNVTVPCEAKHWDLGAEALYLRSVYGADKAYQFASNSALQNIDNDWNWGYRLNGSYHFNTGNDVTVNWTHFSSSVDQAGLAGSLIIAPTVIFPSVPFTLVSRNRLDQVNAVMGQQVDLSSRDSMRFYGGMQYANIQASSQNYYLSPLITALTGFTATRFDNTDFKGFGPSLGIDYVYRLTSALSVTANGASSLLYGTTHYHLGNVFRPANVIYSQTSARKRNIVPSLEAKLGLNYAYPMAQGVLNVDAGYQAINYFNPLNAQHLQSFVAPISSVNYGLFGPYFGLKYVGTI